MIKRVSLFDIGYFLYFISLFLSDVNTAGNDITLIIKLLKYTSYIICICHIFSTNYYSLRNFSRIVLFFSFVGLIASLTRDIYYLAIGLIIFASLYEDKYKILRNSFIMLLTCSIIVAVLTTLGVINNVSNISVAGTTRWGLGYYHSDVFPLVVFYLFSWRILIKERLKTFEIILFIILTLFAYKFCVSKNGLFACCILITYVFINQMIISKNPQFTGISARQQLEFTTHLLLTD